MTTALETCRQTIRPLDVTAMSEAAQRWDTLTKPRGSLGRLETLASRVAGITGSARPRLAERVVFVCAGDHGVVAEGVSAYPSEVTAQMVYNFVRGAAARRCPVVLDGLISTAAALLAVGLAPVAQQYLIAGHRSVEPGHTVALQALGLDPVLDVEMRLGEGTGGVLALTVLEAACRLLDEMATFGEAGVAPGETGQARAEGATP